MGSLNRPSTFISDGTWDRLRDASPTVSQLSVLFLGVQSLEYSVLFELFTDFKLSNSRQSFVVMYLL